MACRALLSQDLVKKPILTLKFTDKETEPQRIQRWAQAPVLYGFEFDCTACRPCDPESPNLQSGGDNGTYLVEWVLGLS